MERRSSKRRLPRFGAFDIRLARLCDRKGWTLGTFWALPEREQTFWLAWEARREAQMDALLKQMRDVQSFDKLAATMMVLMERM